MADYQFAVVAAKVHSSAHAVTEPLAFSALIPMHPTSVPVLLETVLPYVYEIILVDIALMIVAPDAAACGNGTVYEYRSNAQAGIALIEMVSDLTLVASKEALAGIADVDSSLLSGTLDEIKQTPQPFSRKLKLRVLRRPSHRKDREKSPMLQTQGNEILLELLEFRIIPVVDAGHHVEGYGWFSSPNFNCLGCILKSVGTTAHPVVVLLESVEADGHRMYA